MIYEERKYQIEAEDALVNDIYNFNPVIAIPTGAGKTKIMAGFIYKYLEANPYHNILVLSNTENILKQDHEAIQNFFPGIIIGLYSSGLKTREIQKITVAGIQSVYRKPELFCDFDITIIDECHCIPPKGNSMYMKFLNAINSKCIGMSATVFRRGVGLIYEGADALFNKLSYDLTSLENFNKLVDDGYLCTLISKSTNMEMDTKGVKTTAGDYNLKALSKKFDRESITARAIKETIEFGKRYKSWLVFAIDIEHADHITEKLNESGIKTRALHTKQKKYRTEILDQFKGGEIQALVSVGMITTGFDAPGVDLIVMLRPTKSAVLHVQMIGRGTRTCEGKDHCLVLDFAGNLSRLGPINNVLIPVKKGKKIKGGEPPIKTCPGCQIHCHPLVKVCEYCGHVFVFKQKIKEQASSKEVIQRSISNWLNVDDIYYSIHSKKHKPDSMKVIYQCGLSQITEYICLDHDGYAKLKAQNWVNFRWLNGDGKPINVTDLYNNREHLKAPSKLLVVVNAKYPIIEDVLF